MTERWLNTDSITADLDALCDSNHSIPRDEIPLRPVIDRPAAIEVTEDSDYKLLFGLEDASIEDARHEEPHLSEPNIASIIDMLRTYAPDYSNSLIEETYKTDTIENGNVKSDQILELAKTIENGDVKSDQILELAKSTKLNLDGSGSGTLNPEAPEFVSSTNLSLGSLIKRKLQEDLIKKKIEPDDNKKKNRRNVAICSLLKTLSAGTKELASDPKNTLLAIQNIAAKDETLPDIKSSQEGHAIGTTNRGEPSKIPKKNNLLSNSPLAATKHNRVKEWVRNPHSFMKKDMKKESCKFQLDPIGFTSKKVPSLDSIPDNQSVATASGTSSPLQASFAPVSEYVQTKNCDALYLKYQQKAKLRQFQKEDIWTRAEREMKKRDEENLRKQLDENDNN